MVSAENTLTVGEGSLEHVHGLIYTPPRVEVGEGKIVAGA